MPGLLLWWHSNNFGILGLTTGGDCISRPPASLFTKNSFGCYSFNQSLSLACSSNSRLRSHRALLKYTFLHKQSIDLSPRLYFSKTFRNISIHTFRNIRKRSHGVFFLGVYSSRCFCRWRLTWTLSILTLFIPEVARFSTYPVYHSLHKNKAQHYCLHVILL